MTRLVPTCLAVLTAAAVLTGCKPAPPPPPPVAVYAPPRPDAPEFAKCTWGEVKGLYLSIWSFACGPEQSDQHLVADNALPGFFLAETVDGKEQRHLVVRTFPKAPGAPLESILGAVQAASPRLSSSCGFSPAPQGEGGGKAMTLGPVGVAPQQAWERLQKTGGGEPPCGDMGVSFVGDRYFEVMPGHPDRVVYVDMGSEIQIFDPATLRVVQ